MQKRVILRLDGDVSRDGLRVTLEIAPQGQQTEIELYGRLPPMPELMQCIEDWQAYYRSVDGSFRLQPKNVVHRGTLQKRIRECQQSAGRLQSYLIHWLDSRSFRDVDKQLREELNKQEQIQIIIRAQDRRLCQLPWHLWDFMQRYQQAEIAFSSATFRKRFSRSQPTGYKDRVRILAILGSSSGIDVKADRQILNSLPGAEVTFLVEPSRQDLNDHLWGQAWDILFFAGHSRTKGETGHIQINARDELSLNDLRYGLSHAVEQGLRLAIFNSCDGLGLAHALQTIQIPQMIVMREPVPDRIAQKFLRNFLTAFSQGNSLYLAVRQAREQLQGFEERFPCATWLPVIFQNPTETPPTWQELGGYVASHDYIPSILDKQQIRRASVEERDTESFSAPPQTLLFSERLKQLEVDDRVLLISSYQSLCGVGKVDKIIESNDGQLRYRVRFKGSIWKAILDNPAQSVSLTSGDKVRIIGREGITLVIEPMEETSSTQIEDLNFKPAIPGMKVPGLFVRELGNVFRRCESVLQR